MPEADDLYSTLGVERTASENEIRQAYRKLARKWHPDINPGDKNAEDRFKAIAAAYEVLSNKERRARYDEFGQEGLRGGFDPEQARAYKQWQERRAASAGEHASEQYFDLGDLSDLFGGGFAPRSRGPRQGPNLSATIALDFVEALRGKEVTLTAPDGQSVTVRIPPGAADGSQLTVKGRGMPGVSGGPAGDLVIETRVRPHPYFRREGLNLTLTLPVTLEEAYNGASVEVPTPDGTVRLKIPPLSRSGTRLRLSGKGVEKKERRGDLFVELNVVVPDVKDERFSQAVQAASTLYSKPVREGVRL